MLWYFEDTKSYEFPKRTEINNSLTDRFRNSVYENSNEMELYYALAYMLQNKIQHLSVVFPLKELSVNYGNNKDIDINFCDKNNIHYRYENRSGGCMVFFPGNIITLDVYEGETFNRQITFLKDLMYFLQEKGLDAKTNGNDIIVGNEKVVGALSETLTGPYKGQIYFAVQISINADAELISHICTKDSEKSPGFLSKYGITTEEVMYWLLNWFDTHQDLT